ncbi:MAG TPA: MFS transporter [Acidimicrobiales bacterium]|nr:MFS transporter [Acidimicrobiales bacterium]
MTRAEAGVVDSPALADIEATRESLRDTARAQLGVTGDEDTEGFRTLARRYGLSYYPLIALGLLTVSDNFQAYAFTVLTPEISRTLGVSITAVAAARAIAFLAAGIAPLPMAALSQGRPRRAFLCIVTGLVWSVITLSTGFVTALASLVAVLALDGLTSGSVVALHSPLVVDSYPAEARVRALSAYNAFFAFGNVASPLLVGLLSGIVGLSWRGDFLCMGGVSIGISLFSLGLRDPGFGRWDTEQVRATVRSAHGDAGTGPVSRSVSLGFWEICRRVLLIPTIRRMFAGLAVYGVLLIPLNTFLSFFLDQRWNMGPGARGVFFAAYFACGVVALLAYGQRGEKQFRSDPARLLRSAGLLMMGSVVLIAVGAVVPVFGFMLVSFSLSGAMSILLLPLLYACVLSIVPAQMRPHAQSLAAIFLATGSLVGALLLGGVENQYGLAGSLVAAAIPGVLGAVLLASGSGVIRGDLDRMVEEVIEEEEIDWIRRQGARLPMLAVRGVDFSYRHLQVLFDVDFTVQDGEMVALLGVNGAGKSTLLKVVSGIGIPSRGSVRFDGEDITYLDAERRVRLGITQIPGGRAVFGPMTVVENLRAFGYSIGRQKAVVERGIATALATFPRLDERRNSLAATLSGGEQQMLGLAKAVMLQPRLLLIDELSLGLAPVIVTQLLEMVRAINAAGTAVVLVEQSVSIALNLVEHAYFMEKGQVRFDGRAADLLGRDDLLRAVFLKGAAAGSGG